MKKNTKPRKHGALCYNIEMANKNKKQTKEVNAQLLTEEWDDNEDDDDDTVAPKSILEETPPKEKEVKEPTEELTVEEFLERQGLVQVVQVIETYKITKENGAVTKTEITGPAEVKIITRRKD